MASVGAVDMKESFIGDEPAIIVEFGGQFMAENCLGFN